MKSRERFNHCGQNGMKNKAVQWPLTPKSIFAGPDSRFRIKQKARGKYKPAVQVKVWPHPSLTINIPAPSLLKGSLTNCQTAWIIVPETQPFLLLFLGKVSVVCWSSDVEGRSKYLFLFRISLVLDHEKQTIWLNPTVFCCLVTHYSRQFSKAIFPSIF